MIAPETGHCNLLSDIVNGIMSDIKGEADNIGDKMYNIAMTLFKILLVIEIAWFGIKMAVSRPTLDEVLKEFVKVLFISCLMYVILINYKDWINAISYGLCKVYGATSTSFESDIINAIYDKICVIIEGIKMWDAIIQVLTIIVMCVCLGLLTVFITCILLESYVVLNIGVVLLGFGALHCTREFTLNFLKYVLGVGLKLLSMKILAGLLQKTLEEEVVKAQMASAAEYLFLMITVVIITGLFKVVPGIVAGFVSHAAIGSGGVGAVISAGAGAFAGAKMAGQTGGAVASAGGTLAAGAGSAVAKAAGMATNAAGGKTGSTLKGVGKAAEVTGKTLQAGAQVTGSLMQGNLGGAAKATGDAAKAAYGAMTKKIDEGK